MTRNVQIGDPKFRKLNHQPNTLLRNVDDVANSEVFTRTASTVQLVQLCTECSLRNTRQDLHYIVRLKQLETLVVSFQVPLSVAAF